MLSLSSLRFPVADLREGVNHELRQVRPDYLMFKFENATLSSQQTPSLRPLPTAVSVRSTVLDLYYYVSNDLFCTLKVLLQYIGKEIIYNIAE